LKERVAEDALFEDKDKFVTSAYRRKLEEDRKWAAVQAAK
jgi:coiled-coil domain-containing protein 55